MNPPQPRNRRIRNSPSAVAAEPEGAMSVGRTPRAVWNRGMSRVGLALNKVVRHEHTYTSYKNRLDSI